MSHSFNVKCRTRTAILTGIALACACLLAACGPSQSVKQTDAKESESKAAAGAQLATTAKRYPLTGKVVSVDKATHSINVDGDEVPGFMAAMIMPYQVKDAGVLDKVTPGGRIKAEIVVGSDGAYLENIVPAQKAPSPTPRE